MHHAFIEAFAYKSSSYPKTDKTPKLRPSRTIEHRAAQGLRLEQADPNHRSLAELADIRSFKAAALTMLSREDCLVCAPLDFPCMRILMCDSCISTHQNLLMMRC